MKYQVYDKTNEKTDCRNTQAYCGHFKKRLLKEALLVTDT